MVKFNKAYVYELNNLNNKKIQDLKLQVLYYDSMTEIKMNAFFIKVKTPRELNWMFVITNRDFHKRRNEYLIVAENAYSAMFTELKKRYNVSPHKIYVDHISNLKFPISYFK